MQSAAPWPPVRGGDMGLPPGAYPELDKPPQKEQAIRSRLPPGCGSLEEARGLRGRSGDSPPKLPIQCTGGVHGSCHLSFPVGKALA